MSHALQNPTEKPINQAILKHTSNEVKSERIEVICFITLRMPKCKLVGMAQEKILTKKKWRSRLQLIFSINSTDVNTILMNIPCYLEKELPVLQEIPRQWWELNYHEAADVPCPHQPLQVDLKKDSSTVNNIHCLETAPPWICMPNILLHIAGSPQPCKKLFLSSTFPELLHIMCCIWHQRSAQRLIKGNRWTGLYRQDLLMSRSSCIHT